MNCIRVLGASIECDNIGREKIVRIPNSVTVVEERRAVTEARWERPIKTYFWKGEYYIAEEAYRYWEGQSNIDDILYNEILREEGNYDELYVKIRDVILESYVRDRDRIFYE